jgi:hypothetical protein
MEEVTSHVGPSNEDRIYRQLSELEMTRVFVVYRSETVRSADRVIQIGLTIVLRAATSFTHGVWKPSEDGNFDNRGSYHDY